MSPGTIVLLVILAVLIAATIALYFLGKKAQKRKDEQDAQLAATAQTVTMLIIDKKRMRLNQSGLPQAVIATRSSTSFMVGVIYPSYPGYWIFTRPITGRPVSSLIAMTSRILLVRIAGVPACFAARAIRYIMDFSSTYNGSSSTA